MRAHLLHSPPVKCGKLPQRYLTLWLPSPPPFSPEHLDFSIPALLSIYRILPVGLVPAAIIPFLFFHRVLTRFFLEPAARTQVSFSSPPDSASSVTTVTPLFEFSLYILQSRAHLPQKFLNNVFTDSPPHRLFPFLHTNNESFFSPIFICAPLSFLERIGRFPFFNLCRHCVAS